MPGAQLESDWNSAHGELGFLVVAGHQAGAELTVGCFIIYSDDAKLNADASMSVPNEESHAARTPHRSVVVPCR